MPESAKGEALFFGGENNLIRQLRELKGRNIEIALISGTIINGKILGVFNDHILVETYRGRYHIRISALEYVRV